MRVQLNDNAKITSCRITAMPKNLFDPMPQVMVTVEGSNEEHKLFSYYPDEISFSPNDFIGITVRQALNLRHKRDVAYLTS